MKPNIALHFPLFVLIFGLSSCGPDKGGKEIQYVETSPIQHQAVILTEGDQFKKIQDTKSLHLADQFNVVTDPRAGQFKDVHIQSQCHTNYLQETLSSDRQFKNVTQLPVSSLLPLEIFKPTQIDDPKAVCDLQLQYLEEEKVLVNISLKKIEIKGISEFSSLANKTFSGDKPKYFSKSEVEGLNIQTKVNEGYVHTLCNQGRWLEFHSGSQIAMKKSFPLELFENNPMLLCRLVVNNSEETQFEVSPAFFIQKKPAVTLVEFFTNLNGEVNQNFNDDALTWEITNPGETSMYLQFDLPKTEVSILPMMTNRNLQNIYSQRIRKRAQWRIEGGKNQNIKSRNIYALEPKQKMTVSLNLSFQSTCGNLIVFLQGSDICHSDTVYSGLYFEFNSLPKLLINEFGTLSTDRWQDVSLPTQEMEYSSKHKFYALWRPFKRIKTFCSSRKIVNWPTPATKIPPNLASCSTLQ